MKRDAIRYLALGSRYLAAIAMGILLGGLITSGSLGRQYDRIADILLPAHTSHDLHAALLLALGVALIAASLLGVSLLISLRRGKRVTQLQRDAEIAGMSWRLDFALSASEVGVWDVDLNTDQMVWDDRCLALFGAPDRGGYFSESDWIRVLHPEDRDRAVAAADAAVAINGRFVQTYRVVLPSGQIRHVRDMASVYRGEDGSRRLVGLVWDVTADVLRAEELERHRVEAEAATLAKSQFLAAMSHEIRTPMTGVLGMLELIRTGREPEKQVERIDLAFASARSLLRILNDILDFSKLEAHQMRICAEPVAAHQLIFEAIELMAASAAGKHLSLECVISDAVPANLSTDPMRLRQILTNILSNAIKFTDHGRIDVRVDYDPDESGPGGDLRFAVQDTGLGMSDDFRARLFEKFMQADSSLSRRAGGTGLGLAISKQLIELMGGKVWVRSALGLGSTFGFHIRVGPASPPAEIRPPAPVEHMSQAAPLRILLAEDNATNQYLIKSYLAAEGHAVTLVENGAQAVRAVQDQVFDVILMDVQMPEMDGPSATRAIRALPGPVRGIPIIALTANALQGDRESYLAAGMTDYVCKPIDAAALRGALRRATAQPRLSAIA